jgi:hypothetical protein
LKHRKRRDTSERQWLTPHILKEGLDKFTSPDVSPSIMKISAHAELREETRYHAHRYIGTAGCFSDRGNIDFHFPEVIKLYRCHLPHYHRHYWIDSLIDL